MSMRRTILSSAALLAGVSVLPLATPAFAQEAPQASSGSRGDVITVTARRREETLQDVPIAVSAFRGEALLLEQGAQDIGGLQGQVPNLNIVQGRGSNSSANIFIRGIGQPDALATFDPGVGVYVDDVYISRIRGALFDVYDLGRIEVLRGPQGTLYGKNTIGGAIRLVSQAPGDEPEFSASASFGSYNQRDFRLRAAVPLVEDELSASISVYRGLRDGFVQDPVRGLEYNDKDTFAIRGTLFANPIEGLSITFNVDHTSEQPGLTVGNAEAPLFSVDLLGGIAILRLPETGEFDFQSTTTNGFPNSQELDHTGTGLTVEYDLSPSLVVKSITGIRALTYDDYIDIDATELELGDVFVGVDQDQFSQEFQLLYDDGGAFNAVFGLFYLNENIASEQIAFADDFLTLGGAPLAFRRDIFDDLNLHSYAAFAHGEYALSPSLNLSAGLRYTYEQKSYQRGTTTTFDPVGFYFADTESWDDFSPSITLDWQASEDVMVYGRVARGFKSGGFNGRANSAGEESPYDPETVTSYEAGFKSTLADGRVTLNGAVFFNDYRDFQARVRGLNPLDFSLPVLNVGELEQFGAELEFDVAVTDAFSITGNVGYLDANYVEFIDGRVANGDRSGDPVAFAPDWTGRVQAEYVFDMPGGASLLLNSGAQYRGDTVLSVDVAPELTQDAYWLYDANAVWTSQSGHWTMALNARNLSDEVYKTDAQEFSSVGGIRTAYYGAPRTFTFTFGYRY